jgi:hypothetical protein
MLCEGIVCESSPNYYLRIRHKPEKGTVTIGLYFGDYCIMFVSRSVKSFLDELGISSATLKKVIKEREEDES